MTSTVDYSLLTKKEYKFKACRDLFAIFYLSKNCGLTDIEICEKAKALKLTGYAGLTPDCIVRSNIYRWNSIADSLVGVKCIQCTRYANHGTLWNKPTHCKFHATDNMKLVIEQRLYRRDKIGDSRKGKFYLDENFLNRILQINNFINVSLDTLNNPVQDQKSFEINKGHTLLEDKDFSFDDYNSILNMDQHELTSLFMDPLFDKKEDTIPEPQQIPPIQPQTQLRHVISVEDFFGMMDTMWQNVEKNTQSIECRV